ncbi:RNA polymerase sigma factor [Cesiribacter sp. SM1]|uniref:RNA polymerase sigma factor n=1 Tax=Cesiribacter sp. SM1 TaxID=2861196 RepID=UPI001CD264CA|nr:RNA polymerase sigma factor [Cesiribacter sp. SM1]
MSNKNLHTTKEGVLIAAAVQGDQSSLSKLYTRYYPKVAYRCLSIVKDKATADDLAQDVLLKAIEKLPLFQLQASFSTWLYSIATNHCLEHLRKEKQHQSVSLEEGMHICIDEPEQETQFLLGSLEKNLSIYLKQMSKEDQSLLIAKYCKNKSIRELQDIYSLSASAIKMRLKRSKERLAQLLDQSTGS